MIETYEFWRFLSRSPNADGFRNTLSPKPDASVFRLLRIAVDPETKSVFGALCFLPNVGSVGRNRHSGVDRDLEGFYMQISKSRQ